MKRRERKERTRPYPYGRRHHPFEQLSIEEQDDLWTTYDMLVNPEFYPVDPNTKLKCTLVIRALFILAIVLLLYVVSLA